jgi:hypothetical protein
MVLLWSFGALVLRSFRIQRFFLHHTIFSPNVEVANFPKDASPYFQDFDSLELRDLEDFST